MIMAIVRWLTGFEMIVGMLRALQARAAPDELAVIRVRFDDPVAWETFGACTDCGVRGLPVGQLRDCRYPLPDGTGLHGHAFGDCIEYHLDECDPCRDVAGHAAADTQIAKGAAVGLLGGGILAILTRNPRMVLVGLGLGAAGGVMTPKRPKRIVYELRALVAPPPVPPQLSPWA